VLLWENDVSDDVLFPQRARPRSLPPPNTPEVGATVGMKAMKQESTTLRAQTLALQAVLTNVLFELKILDPVLADAIARGFDNAANQIEDAATRTGTAASSEPLVKALSIIEDLRTASLRRS
jgi:hypothetical protein